MREFSASRRSVLRGLAAGGAAAALPSAAAAAEFADETDPTTRATFGAVVDAVIPATPDLAADLGSEHEPGGLEVGLEDYLLAVTNSIFSLYDAPGLVVAAGVDESVEVGGETVIDVSTEVRYERNDEFNARLAELVAKVCDAAAVELLARGENEDQPDPGRFEAGGPFASLSRSDRLRALSLLDDRKVDTAELPGPVAEGSAALVPQLLVAFTEGIYYSEWQGYDEFRVPPGERAFSETVDGERLQSWRQTEFPGVIAGAVAFRGYWGAPDASLGEGRVWKSYDGDGDVGPTARIYHDAGEFVDGDYDTSGYEEPFDTSGEPPDDGGPGGTTGEARRPEDAVEAARESVDEDLLARAREELLGQEVSR
jgi:hypothetical protein